MPYVEVNGIDLSTIAGAGHNPHATHPADFAAVVEAHAGLEEAVR
jgi:pimeloyl-ACP methyl ester carboxylesterase